MNTDTPTISQDKNFKLEEPTKYRLFISYSHEDEELVKKIVDIIDTNKMLPMWDKNFAYGEIFPEQIKNYIAHAHVFIPVLTKTADSRKWVHQEIGYAMALNVHVLPLAVGELPREMIQQIHALKVDPENISLLEQQLSVRSIRTLVDSSAGLTKAYFTCAPLPEDRARMMSEYSDEVQNLGYCGIVRQKGALSSFHIPTELADNNIWKRRYGMAERTEEHCSLQRKERLSLQKHVDSAGCKLIINPWLRYERYGEDARLCRLESILKFLNEMLDDQCWVAIKEMDPRLSTTILGDWFLAESLAGFGGTGYRQTIFTRHTPTIIKKIEDFDFEFDDLLKQSKVKKEDSRKYAIQEIEKIIDGLLNKK